MSMPIISNDLRSSCRALLLQSFGSGGETEVGWKYPSDWPQIPNAGEGECILLIRPSESRKKFTVRLNTYYADALKNFPDYEAVIDWGDGNVETIDNECLSSIKTYNDTLFTHEYTDEFIGKYLFVKIQTMYAYKENGDGTTNRIAALFMGSRNSDNEIFSVLAASVGKSFETPESGTSLQAMYVRFCMDDFNELSVDSIYNDWSTKPYSGYYRHAFSIFTSEFTKRIDFTEAPTVFGSAYNSQLETIKEIRGVDSVEKLTNGYLFGGNRALNKISFPNLAEIPQNCFSNSNAIREIYVPKCKKIGAGSLSSNYCLQKLTIAKGCEIAPTALQNNYQYVEITEV